MPSCSPQSSLTPSCLRVFCRLQNYLKFAGSVQPEYLVLAVLAEESLASACLSQQGISLATAKSGGLGSKIANSFEDLLSVDQQSDTSDSAGDFTSTRQILVRSGAGWFASVLERAQSFARQQGDGDVSTEHLMLGMIEAATPVQSLLNELGVDSEIVRQQFRKITPPAPVLKVDFEFDLPLEEDEQSATTHTASTVDQRSRVVAVIDANLNRCREGLRVLDDFARFVLRSNKLTASLKHLRHRLVSAEKQLLATIPDMLESRNTEADAGTSVSTPGEMSRTGVEELVAANARRVQESLRSLEEFGKLLSPEFAAEVKQIRYESYKLHQQLCVPEQKSTASILEIPTLADATELPESRIRRLKQLAAARLYVLLTESLCQRPWQEVVEEVLAGGADVIQLREKQLSANEVVSRGRWIATACKKSGALFIMNDVPEIAAQADADGVHVGQEDISAQAARQAVGASRLVGLSTHNERQIRDGCLSSDVDYLGVGPVFPSGTKLFDEFPGLTLVNQASQLASLPWFAIGGIQPSNLPDVTAAGATGVAVCGAIIGGANPREATAAIRAMLDDGSPDLLKFSRG